MCKHMCRMGTWVAWAHEPHGHMGRCARPAGAAAIASTCRSTRPPLRSSWWARDAAARPVDAAALFGIGPFCQRADVFALHKVVVCVVVPQLLAHEELKQHDAW